MTSLFRRLRRGKKADADGEPEVASDPDDAATPDPVETPPEYASNESSAEEAATPAPLDLDETPEAPAPSAPTPMPEEPESPSPPQPPPADLPPIPTGVGVVSPPEESRPTPPPLPERDESNYVPVSAPGASTTCFLCGSRLDAGRCPTCQMTWVE
ncbi:MAG TPA: hypothetical protein VGV89_10865 [Thermoplasmata archaeon]|nr:hypothetical protein [Thermoplasmata archaeon]